MRSHSLSRSFHASDIRRCNGVQWRHATAAAAAAACRSSVACAAASRAPSATTALNKEPQQPHKTAAQRLAAGALALLAVAAPAGGVVCGAAYAAVSAAPDGLQGAALVAAAPASSPGAIGGGSARSADPVYDGARVVAAEVRDKLSAELRELEAASGFKVRVFTASALEARGASPRELWGPPDARSVWLRVDPSSPNILNLVYIGDEPLFKLRRPFFQELQTRYGNQFFVRDNGETAAVTGAVGALAQCLAAPEGCKVVPGLPQEQQAFTAAFAAAGGIIAGFVSRLPPQGIVSRRFVWLIIFSPLWASLFLNFGIGPIVSRTDDPVPVLINCGVFLACFALPYLDKLLAPPAPSSSDS